MQDNFNDEWFFDKLRSDSPLNKARSAFRVIHGNRKNPALTLELIQRHNDPDFAAECRKSLSQLDKIVPPDLAQLVRYCAVVYANFCDEIFAGLDDFYFQSILMEWLLHASYSLKGKRYRDHLTHQIKVCLLGLEFIENLPMQSNSFLSEIVDKQRNSALFSKFYLSELDASNVTPEVINSAWLLSTMFHDLGYCYVNFVGVSDHLGKVSNFFKLDSSRKIWRKVRHRIAEHSSIVAFFRKHGDGLSSTSTLSEVKKAIFQSAFHSHNHSVIGALYLLYMLDQVEDRLEHSFKDYQEVKLRLRLVFEIAALAILTHDIDSPSKRTLHSVSRTQMMKEGFQISFKDAPLSYLLGFCDQLQEWGRVRIARLPVPKSNSCTDKYIIDCQAVKIAVNGKSLNIQFVFENSEGIDPGIPIFGKKGMEAKPDITIQNDIKKIWEKYPEGRMSILNSIYGANPVWEHFYITVDIAGKVYRPEDFFTDTSTKALLSSLST